MIDRHNYSIDFFHNAPLFAGKVGDKLRKFHLSAAYDCAHAVGLALEFGVFNALTLNALARKLAPSTVYGFDSFEGLPETWNMTETESLDQGAFAVDTLPHVESNVELVVGWFDQTLPQFLLQHQESVKFLHIDCDLYSSTLFVLKELDSRIHPGTVIVFDELYAWHNPKLYTNWEQGEYAALRDWMTEYDREIEVLYKTDYFQASIIVRK